MHRRNILKQLDFYGKNNTNENEVIKKFKSFISQHKNCFDSHFTLGHITASAWIMDAKMERVLLTHHRKLDKWLQLGGHSDMESVSLNVALREAQEESGINNFTVLSDEIFDLDIHHIPARDGADEHYHYDVRFILQAQVNDYIISEESYDLAWVHLDDLEKYNFEETVLRMRKKTQRFL